MGKKEKRTSKRSSLHEITFDEVEGYSDSSIFSPLSPFLGTSSMSIPSTEAATKNKNNNNNNNMLTKRIHGWIGFLACYSYFFRVRLVPRRYFVFRVVPPPSSAQIPLKMLAAGCGFHRATALAQCTSRIGDAFHPLIDFSEKSP